MTNQELAVNLRALADVYDSHGESLLGPSLYIFAISKQEVVLLLRAIGGKFAKRISGDSDSYAQIYFESQRIPGVTIAISRDKVCRKTVKWDCEPMFSPEEDSEIDGLL